MEKRENKWTLIIRRSKIRDWLLIASDVYIKMFPIIINLVNS